MCLFQSCHDLSALCGKKVHDMTRLQVVAVILPTLSHPWCSSWTWMCIDHFILHQYTNTTTNISFEIQLFIINNRNVNYTYWMLIHGSVIKKNVWLEGGDSRKWSVDSTFITCMLVEQGIHALHFSVLNVILHNNPPNELLCIG